MSRDNLILEMTDAGMTKAAAIEAIDAVTNGIQASLAKGNEIALVGFGKFSVKHRAARTGRNPQTGAEMQIPAAKVPGFTAGKKLKDAVK